MPPNAQLPTSPSSDAAPLARGPAERLLAWLYTGPPGHLYGAVADITVLWMRWIVGRARARLRSLVSR